MSEGKSTAGRLWRHGVLLAAVLVPLALLLSLPPIPQDLAYHDFADQRTWLGIPNFLDVVSNIAYVLVGIAGIRFCLRMAPGGSKLAWLVGFAGVALVAAGSAFYHWNPTNDTLMWDRLPMTIGFTAFFVALLGDYVNPRLCAPLLVPVMLLGLASVIYGHTYDDLRLYAWVQSLPLLVIAAAVLVYPPRYTRRSDLLVAFGCYVLAKLAEVSDRQVFEFMAGMLSGHTVKHLVAALAIWVLLRMIERRTPVGIGRV